MGLSPGIRDLGSCTHAPNATRGPKTKSKTRQHCETSPWEKRKKLFF